MSDKTENILISPKLGRQHYNSSGKSVVYDHVELEKVSASDRNTDGQPEIAV